MKNHDSVALAISKNIEKPQSTSLTTSLQLLETPSLLPIPPEYATASKTTLVDVEGQDRRRKERRASPLMLFSLFLIVTLLNAQARVGTLRPRERKRVWSEWLYRLMKAKGGLSFSKDKTLTSMLQMSYESIDMVI